MLRGLTNRNRRIMQMPGTMALFHGTSSANAVRAGRVTVSRIERVEPVTRPRGASGGRSRRLGRPLPLCWRGTPWDPGWPVPEPAEPARQLTTAGRWADLRLPTRAGIREWPRHIEPWQAWRKWSRSPPLLDKAMRAALSALCATTGFPPAAAGRAEGRPEARPTPKDAQLPSGDLLEPAPLPRL